MKGRLHPAVGMCYNITMSSDRLKSRAAEAARRRRVWFSESLRLQQAKEAPSGVPDAIPLEEQQKSGNRSHELDG